MNFIIVPINLTSKIGMRVVDQKVMINLVWPYIGNLADALTECVSAKLKSTNFRLMKTEAFSRNVSKVFQPQSWH